jgi:multicomponent Na+:H+ antiporter subunit F
MTVVTTTATLMLGVAAALCLFRIYRGPSALDRILAIDVLLVVLIAGVALESMWSHRATNLPLIMILTIVSYIGGVSITRLLSRDSDDETPESDGASP